MAISRQKEYDSVSVGSSFKVLPKGAYICRLMMAEEMTSSNGKPMLHIAFDIIEGDYKNYFMDMYQSRKKSNTDPLKEIKWPFEGQKWIMANDYEDDNKPSRQFKSFITSVEESGTEVWTPKGELNLDELKNAEVGIVFQRVEHEYNGKASWRTEPWGFRSIEAVASGECYIPDDKPLPVTQGTGFSQPSGSADSFSAAEDDIPF